MHRIAILRRLLIVPVLLVSMSAWAVTQDELDKAVSCCWLGNYGTYCSTRNACSSGSSCCSSHYFAGFPFANNNSVQCSIFSGGGSSTTAQAESPLSRLTGSAPAIYPVSIFMADGMLNVDALGEEGYNACTSGQAVSASDAGPLEAAQAPAVTQNFNAAGVAVERLFLEENEGANPPVIGFLPYDDRFAVEGDSLYALGWSENKGFELVEVRDTGGPRVHDFNPKGSSYAGYPNYDQSTIKAFDGKLFFYARLPGTGYKLSSLKTGSPRRDVNDDNFGSDVPLAYVDGSGSRNYRGGHIRSIEVHRDMLMTAGSQRVSVDTGGLDLGDVRMYDIEPQRIHRGKKPVAELLDVYPDGPSLPRNMVDFNGAVYMVAKVAGGYSPCGEGRDYELVRLNDDGSSQVIEINPHGYGFYPNVDYPPMQVHAGNLYLVANLGAPGSDHHELVRVTPSHEVTVLPINPDDGAFPSIREMDMFWYNWDVIPARLSPLGDALYVIGANIGGSCLAGCANPYEADIAKIDADGDISVIDPFPGATFLSNEPANAPVEFLAAEFAGDLYFVCEGCNVDGLFHLDANDAIEFFPDWPVRPLTRGTREPVLGVRRGDSLYMTSIQYQDGLDLLVRLDPDGSFHPLTSPDMGYNYVYSMALVGDTIVAGAAIFTSPERDYDSNYIGLELLLIHPDDSLGYVDVAPGFDGDNYPYSSFPWGLNAVGDSVVFASYTDPAYESPYNEMFRVRIGGAGSTQEFNTRGVSSVSADTASGSQRTWPVSRLLRGDAGKANLGENRALRKPDHRDRALASSGAKKAGLSGLGKPDIDPLGNGQAGKGQELVSAEQKRRAEARARARMSSSSCEASPD